MCIRDSLNNYCNLWYDRKQKAGMIFLRKSTGIPGEAGSERESGIEAGMYECAEAVYQNERCV